MARLTYRLLAALLLAPPVSASAVDPRYRGRRGALAPDGASLLHRARETPSATVGGGGAGEAVVTAAPILPDELLRARAASVTVSLPACAKSCIDSAILSDSPCTVSDVACGCQSTNAGSISSAAAACVETACGYVTAFYAWSTLESVCLEYFLTAFTSLSYTTGATEHAGTTTTTTGAAQETSTSAAASETTGSSGSRSGGSALSTSSSNALSKGAVAGIAVGAAGGAVLLCAVLFLVYRCVSRNRQSAAAAPPSSGGGAGEASVPPAAANDDVAAHASPMTAAAVPGGRNELDGKSSMRASATVTPTAPPPPPQAHPVSPVSPSRPPVAGQPQSGQQQQPYVVQGYSIAPGQPPQAQSVVAPAGYAAAHPGLPQPGVLYQEAPDGTPAPIVPQELTGHSATSGMHEMPTQYGSPGVQPGVEPGVRHVAPVASPPAPNIFR